MPPAALTCLRLFAPAAALPWQGWRRSVTGLLAGSLLLAPGAVWAQVEVERVELDARVAATPPALYAKAKLILRNRSPASFDTLELEFPAPLGARAQLRGVWDREGELPWRTSPVEPGAARTLLVAFSRPVAPGKKATLVVSYDLDLQDYETSTAPVAISASGARLATTGWYPLPTRADPANPQGLRLVVRLPKEWPVQAAVKLKQIRDGTALASYELELKSVVPGEPLLEAGTALPP